MSIVSNGTSNGTKLMIVVFITCVRRIKAAAFSSISGTGSAVCGYVLGLGRQRFSVCLSVYAPSVALFAALDIFPTS